MKNRGLLDAKTSLVALIFFFLIVGLFYVGNSQTENSRGTRSVFQIAEGKPEVQYFRNEFEVTGRQGYILSEKHVRKRIDEIRKDCGQSFRPGQYWRLEYRSSQGKDLVLWIDAGSEEVVCINFDMMEGDLTEELAIKQERKEIDVKQAQLIEERLYFYSIGGKRTYYISVRPLEKPDWEFSIEPILHLYEPMDKEPVEMSVKVEPSNLSLTRPENVPENVEYIDLENLTGYIRSKFVDWRLQVPKPSPVTGKGVTGDFEVKFNVTAKYFEIDRWKVFKSTNVTYNIHVEPK